MLRKRASHLLMNTSQSVGLHKILYTTSPEIFISGISGENAPSIINNMVFDIQNGSYLVEGNEYDAYLDGYNCYFDLVDKSNYDNFFSKAVWFYQEYNFPVIQCVWPNKEHKYPWETSQSFRQDVLFKYS